MIQRNWRTGARGQPRSAPPARWPHTRSGRAARTAFATALALACLLAGRSQAEETPSGAAPSELAALMDHLANGGTVRADIKETRQLALLVDAIETEGVLYFAPPNRLARHTTRPGSSRVVIHGGRVAIRDETGTRALELGSSGVASSLIGNLMVLLRGDLPGLHERYTIAFASDGQSWQLDLEPRAKAVRAIIEGIRFSGTGWTIGAMETRETNGDTSLAVFSAVETQLALSPDEFERIFSVDLMVDSNPSGSPATTSTRKPRAPGNR